MVLLTKIFPSCVQTFLNKNSFLALVSICIRFYERLSVILIPVSFNFFSFLNTLFLMFRWQNLMMIGLDCLPFLSLLVRWLRSIWTSVRFSYKSSFRHNNIGIFILTFLYTMHQNTVSTRVLLLTVNYSI